MPALTTDMIPGPPRLAVDHVGAGSLVIFLHSIGGNRTNWHDQLGEIGGHFHAVAWDARGYGESDDYAGALDFGDFAVDLGRVIDHFGAARAHLGGLSMGGVIALDFACRYPDRVATLTLCDTMPGFGHLTDAQRRDFIRLRQEPLLAGKEPRDIASVVAKTLLGKAPRPGCFERLVASMAALHKESYIKTIRGSVNYSRPLRLETITAPVHIVVGEEDTLTPPSMSLEMTAYRGRPHDGDRTCRTPEQYRTARSLQSCGAGFSDGASRAYLTTATVASFRY